MKLSSTAIILIALVVVVIIAIVIGAVRFKIKAAAAVGKSMSSSDSDTRHSVSTPQQKKPNLTETPRGKYEVQRGQKVEVAPPQAVPEAKPEDFQRHKAMAGKAESLSELQRKIRSHANFRETESIHAAEQPAQPRTEVKAEPKQRIAVEIVHVDSLADLFSVKEDVEAEYGVTQEEMSKMVAQYKKSKEYVERALPVSRYFNIDTYNESRQTLRESAKNMGVNHASKRGQITSTIYKKYGKNFTKSSKQPTGDVMSSIVGNSQHREHLAKDRGSRNHGHLEAY